MSDDGEVESGDPDRVLYQSLGDFFQEDGGYLPAVQIGAVSREKARAIYSALLGFAAPLRPYQTVWDPARGDDRALGGYPEAGRLAAEGRERDGDGG